MDLVPFIFHERQERGSQLCAQHCLNNLLQQSVYSEFDLADVARKLDEQENVARYARAPEASSYNYDDTGFFSISVLEKAMQVWDLTLVRWRGEAMQPYQDVPEEQTAFILNLDSHWFAIRRFGSYSRWYNLNSFLERPEWISPTYLRMVLKQAEDEGYSVFVIRRAGEGAGEDASVDPGEALGWGDAGVGELPESAADQIALELGDVTSRGGAVGEGEGGGPVNHFPSLPAGPSRTSTQPNLEPEPSSGAGSGRRRRRQEDLTAEGVEEQDRVPGSNPGSGSRTPQANRSYVEVAASGVPEDEDEELDGDAAPSRSYAAHRFDAHNFGMYGGPTDFQFNNRSYDDEDEALQAALCASMEDVPDGYVMPELAPLNPAPARRASPPQPAPQPVAAPEPPSPVPARSETREDSIVDDTDDDEPAHEPSPEELRRARLARFQ